MNAPNSTVAVGNTLFSNAAPLTLIAGPCQLESRGHAFDMAADVNAHPPSVEFGNDFC